CWPCDGREPWHVTKSSCCPARFVFRAWRSENASCARRRLVKNCAPVSARRPGGLRFGGSTIQLFNDRTNEHGPRQTAHSGTGRSQRENLSRLLFANDRPSRAGIQRPLRENSAATADTFLHTPTRFPQHLLRLGRDGRGDSQSRV